DGGAARAVELRRGLGQPVEVGEVLDRRAAAPVLQVGHEGRAVDGGGDHVVAAYRDRVCGVARLDLEGRGRPADLLQDEGAVEPHTLPLDLHPGLLKEVAGALVEEVDTELFQDRHRLLVDDLDVLGREDVVSGQAVTPHRAAPSGAPRHLPHKGGGNEQATSE